MAPALSVLLRLTSALRLPCQHLSALTLPLLRRWPLLRLAPDVCRFGAASYVPALVLEKPLFVRERSDGLYRPITYLLSKFFDEIFITIFASLIFSAVVFFAVDLTGSFLVFWLTYFLTLSIGIAMAYFIATLSPNMDVANAALPAYTVRRSLITKRFDQKHAPVGPSQFLPCPQL